MPTDVRISCKSSYFKAKPYQYKYESCKKSVFLISDSATILENPLVWLKEDYSSFSNECEDPFGKGLN